MIHSLRAFRHRNYRLFFCGQSLAVLGNWKWIGAKHTLAAGGVACMLVAFWLWRRLPELRGHIRPIDVKLGIISEWSCTQLN